MKCERCQGLLVKDCAYDLLASQPDWETSCDVMRCMNCGDVIDEVILQHRAWRWLGRAMPKADDRRGKRDWTCEAPIRVSELAVA